jgi:hypothetical protein
MAALSLEPENGRTAQRINKFKSRRQERIICQRPSLAGPAYRANGTGFVYMQREVAKHSQVHIELQSAN